MAKRASKTSEAAGNEDRIRVWNSCQSTPSEYLKDFKKAGGFSGKSIDPVYRIRKLTELFGPCGQGWCFVQEDQWSESGSGAYVVYVRGHLWWKDPETGATYQTMSHTGGTVADRAPDEAYKMAETDALGKCCLDLGMSADVYLGCHDADKYQRASDDRSYSPTGRSGRKTAGTSPQSKASAPPAKPIAVDDLTVVMKEIADLADDPAAYAYSRSLFNRLAASADLDAKQKASIAERVLGKRCEFATEGVLPNLKQTAKAYVAQGWLSKETADKIITLTERKLGIPPSPGSKE
jgi:hypothetical protein